MSNKTDISKRLETPKLNRSEGQGKITLYFSRSVDDLYRTGKDNGWDVCEIVRKAASDALLARAEILKTQAKDDDREAG